MNSKDPLISIVIPTFNHANYLDRSIKSILMQTYPNWEIIIVDNNSTDETDEVIKKYNHLNLRHLCIENSGIIAKSRNLGIQHANGNWIAFLDSDDWWTGDKLQSSVDIIKSDKVDLVYHDLISVNQNEDIILSKRFNSSKLKKPILKSLLAKGNIICNSSVVVRKSIINKVGGINESKEMVAAEDYNTWLKISKVTENFKYIPKKLGFYYIHADGTSNKNMYFPTKIAVKEFYSDLNYDEKIKLKANLAYMRAKFDMHKLDHKNAKEDLLYTVKHGYIMLKIKAILFLMLFLLKNFLAK